MNKKSTLIECSPGKNIIYTVLPEEADLIWHMVFTHKSIHGKWPKIIDMIDYIRNNPRLFGNYLFKDMKIEEKEIPPIKGKTLDYVFVDDCDLYDRFANE